MQSSPLRPIRFVVLALAVAGCADDASPDRATLVAVVERLLGGPRVDVMIEPLAAPSGRDTFEIDARGGKLVLRGSSGVAVASALDRYLAESGRGHLSWTGDRITPGSLPPLPQPVRRESPHAHRYAYNFTVHGYTTPFWDWPRWEREIDLLAAKGFNRALVTVGTEKALLETFTRFGYVEEELRDWLVQPPYQPFQLLGNVESFGAALSRELIDARAALAGRIAERMRELGIEPVVPGYYGLVPPDFAERHGGAPVVVEQGLWLGQFSRPDLLDPTDAAFFDPVADAYYDALRSVFGEVRFFAADPFHEGGQSEGIDVTAAARAIASAMQRAAPQPVWVIQAWLGNPRAEVLTALDPEHALVIDLWGDEAPSYRGFTSAGEPAFQGIPWLWSIIQNFGGRSGITGNLEMIAAAYADGGAFHDPHRARLEGLGLTMEATEQNSVVLELLAEMTWRSPAEGAILVDAWIADFADRRYGAAPEPARAAWRKLLATAYSRTPGQQGPNESILCARPALTLEKASTFGPGDPYYDTSLLEEALGDLLEAAPTLAGVDPYEHDVVDLTRQVLANRARPLLDEIRHSFEATDRAGFTQHADAFLDLIADQDRLLSTRRELLLGRWLQDARRWGASLAESDALEHGARLILTGWGEADTILRDYAHREWAGLVGDYFHRRWSAFFADLASRLDGAEPAPPDFHAIESAWVSETDPEGIAYPAAPRGAPVLVAGELYAKWIKVGVSSGRSS